jgi:uncharacterized protein YunC (DUF1805 family)
LANAPEVCLNRKLVNFCSDSSRLNVSNCSSTTTAAASLNSHRSLDDVSQSDVVSVVATAADADVDVDDEAVDETVPTEFAAAEQHSRQPRTSWYSEHVNLNYLHVPAIQVLSQLHITIWSAKTAEWQVLVHDCLRKRSRDRLELHYH